MKRWCLWTAVVCFVGLAMASTVRRQVAVRDRPLKGAIVSLAPSVTEILFALGLQDRLVGVTTICDYPPAAKRLPKVADFGVPDIELLYALKPELVIATELRDPEAKGVIARLGVRLLEAKQGSIEEVLAAIETIGAAAGVADAARVHVDRIRERIARATVDVPAAQRPRVYIELSSHPLSTAGQGSFIDDLIHRAGGRNIAHDAANPWTIISPDDVVASNPEIIIAAHAATGGTRYVIENRIGWSGISAVKAGRIITDLNPDLIARPGPRVADGLEALARIFAAYREEQTP